MSIQARIIIGLLSCLIASSITWRVQDWRWAEKLHNATIEQLQKDEEKCKNDKQITEDANHALQKNIDNIQRKLAAYRLQPTPKCIMPTAESHQPAASGGEHAGQNGVSTDWLRSYAAECEQYRQERIALESFEDKVWGG